MIDHSLWREFYRIDTFPPLPCPSCASGKVTLRRDTLRAISPAYVTDLWGTDHWNPGDDTGSFTCMLICDSPKCGEVVAVSGTTREVDDSRHYGEDESCRVFEPSMMSPPPPLFPVPADLPWKLKAVLVSAFSLFWIDEASCANRLRVFVEALMKHYAIDAGNLAQRISAFESRSPEHARTFHAIRLVGNVASHEADVRRRTLVDIFHLLEDALVDLFERDREIDLAELKEKIIVKRGRPSFEGGIPALNRLMHEGY